MNNDITGLIDAIQAKAWYPLIAYAIAIIISVWSRWQPRLLEEVDGKPPILNPRIQWLPAVIIAGGSAFIDGYFSNYSWQLSLGLALYTMSTGGVGAVGVHRVAKEAKGGAAAALVLVMILGLSQACSFQEAKGPINTADDVARYLCAVFHSKKAGISLQEAIDTSCDTLEKIRPFYKPIIALEKAGSAGASPETEAVPECPVPVKKEHEPSTVFILIPVDAGTQD